MEAMASALHSANPGRSGYGPSIDASRLLFETRENLARLLNMSNIEGVVFTSGASMSLNLAIASFVNCGIDKIVTTNLEHNSVARPVSYLKKEKNINWTILPAVLGDFDEHLRHEKLNEKSLVIVNHISNVTGVRQNIAAISDICQSKGAYLLLDASQSLGCEPMTMESVDVLCASAHKGLKGPMGIGFMVMAERVPYHSWLKGGTGSASESLEPPNFLPDHFEVGTPNMPGIAASNCAIKALNFKTLERHAQELQRKRSYLFHELQKIEEIKIYGPEIGGTALSINLERIDIGELAHQLWKKHQICLRVGLHCSSMAHRALGTFPHGTLRISPAYDTKEEEIKSFLEALKTEIRQYR